jgi:hypothetical protein
LGMLAKGARALAVSMARRESDRVIGRAPNGGSVTISPSSCFYLVWCTLRRGDRRIKGN